MEFYEGMFREKQDPTVQLSLAARYAELGQVQSEIGTLEQALEPLKKSERVQRRLVEQNPTNSEYQCRRGVNLYKIGYCCWEHSQNQTGITVLRESIQVLSKVAESNPKHVECALHLALA